MPNNLVSKGKRVPVVAPSGGAVSGRIVVLNNLFGVAMANAASGENVVLDVTQETWLLPKANAASTSFAVGANVHWDATNAVATPSATSNLKVGVAVVAASNTDTTVTTLVRG